MESVNLIQIWGTVLHLTSLSIIPYVETLYMATLLANAPHPGHMLLIEQALLPQISLTYDIHMTWSPWL